MCCLYNTSNLIYLLSFDPKESNKENLFCFFTFSLCNARCILRRLRDYLAALRLRQSFCSGLYEAFKGGFAARLIAPVLRGCDTKSFVSLTSLSLVHRPAASAGYPPLPRAVGLFLNLLILLNLFIQLPIMSIISCLSCDFRIGF